MKTRIYAAPAVKELNDNIQYARLHLDHIHMYIVFYLTGAA